MTGTVIVVAYNCREACIQLLRTLKVTAPQDDYRLVLVDNGCNDGLRDVVSSCADDLLPPDVVLIRNDLNVAFAPAINQAIDYAKGDCYAILCARGCITTKPGWLEMTAAAFKKHPEWGLAGMLGDHAYYIPPDLERTKLDPKGNDDGCWTHVQGGIMMVNPKMVEDIGAFSPRYPFLWNDVEYSNRALCCGWELGELPFVFSTCGDHERAEKYFETQAESHALFHHAVDLLAREAFLVDQLGEPFRKTQELQKRAMAHV